MAFGTIGGLIGRESNLAVVAGTTGLPFIHAGHDYFCAFLLHLEYLVVADRAFGLSFDMALVAISYRAWRTFPLFELEI